MFKYKSFLERTPKLLLSWFVFDAILLVVWLSGSDNHHKVTVAAVLTIGLLSFLFYEESGHFINWLAKNRRLNFLKFLLLGLSGAIVVELVFLFWQKALGTFVIPTDQNFILDFGITLLIYSIILAFFWFIQKVKNYSLGKVFVFGGVCELIVEMAVAGIFKQGILLSLFYGLISLPLFMIAFSLILLPPALFLKKA